MNPTERKARDKLYKKQLSDWTVAKNRCLSAYSFKELKTYEDLLTKAGVNVAQYRATYGLDAERLSQPTDRAEIISFFQPFKDELDREYAWDIKGRHKAPPFEELFGHLVLPINGKTVPLVKQNIVDVTELTEDDLCGTVAEHDKLPHSDRQKCFLFPFQERAASAILRNIVKHGYQGQLLRAAVGTGKTFIIGAVIARLLDMKFCAGKSYSPWPICYVTRASIVEQTKRVLATQFSCDTLNEVNVINIEVLRSSLGELMVRPEVVVEEGEEHIKWKWRLAVHPLIIFWDECQALKNVDSQQSRIAQAFNDIVTPKTFQVFFSATPFMRVSEAKCFCVSTRITHKFGIAESPLSNDHWSDFANKVASPADPIEYSPAAVERLMERMDKYIVDVKGVRSQFNAQNSVNIIDFQSESEREYYDRAWDRYNAMKQKIEGYDLSASQSRFLILAQFTVFRRAAEIAKAEYFAQFMVDCVNNGQAGCLAVSFKATIRRVTDILVNRHGISRDDISLIWGGGKTGPNKKQKQKMAIASNEELLAVLKDAGLDMSALNLADVEDYVEEEDDPTLRLGNQSLKERQREIDRFQSGKSRFCMFTFKAGGVGLSLHHSDELTARKCKRKKNGWYVTDDIPNIPVRQRVVILAPTYSAIELVQGLGRCPRLTSMSDTPQTIVFYRGTIEERVAAIVSLKLRCLRKVVRTRESWEDVIVGGIPESEGGTKLQQPQKQISDAEDDDDSEEGGLFMGDDPNEDSK